MALGIYTNYAPCEIERTPAPGIIWCEWLAFALLAVRTEVKRTGHSPSRVRRRYLLNPVQRQKGLERALKRLAPKIAMQRMLQQALTDGRSEEEVKDIFLACKTIDEELLAG